MRSPALSLAWHLWRPHRWGVATFLAYLFGLFVTARILAAADLPATDVRNFVSMASIPFVFGMLYLMAVFAHPDADVAATRSGYPTYLLLLPVRTRDLVLWPMLSGTVAIGLGWIVLARFILLPMGVSAPAGWPAAMLAALLASLQVIFWSPLALPYLRVILALAVMPALLTLGFWGGVLHGTSPAVLIALFLGVIPVACLAAVTGLARARRGDNPEWHVFFRRTHVAHEGPRRCRRPFSSSAQAQLWFEWRSNGMVLPLLVAATGLFFSLPLIWLREQAPLADLLLPPLLFAPGMAAIRANVCLTGQQYALLMPPLLALIVGCGLQRHDHRQRDAAVAPFLTTRPMSSGDLVLARLKMAGLSTLAAWAVTLLYAGAWLLLPARDGAVTAPLAWLLLRHGTIRSGLIVLLLLAALVGWTWKNQVQTLFVDLAGRAWAVCGYPIALGGVMSALFLLFGTSPYRDSLILPLLLLPLLGALLALRAWIVYGYPAGAAGLTLSLLIFLILAHTDPDKLATLRQPLIGAAVLVASLKLLAAARTLHLLRRRGLIEAKALARLLTGWLLVATGLFVLLRSLLPIGLIPPWSLALGIALLLPLTQLALAPLALASNRHR